MIFELDEYMTINRGCSVDGHFSGDGDMMATEGFGDGFYNIMISTIVPFGFGYGNLRGDGTTDGAEFDFYGSL